MEKITYGVIGAGMMGREHIQNIALLSDAEVGAFAEPDRAQQDITMALVPHAKVYTSCQDILKDTSIDAWVVASPNFTHFEVLNNILRQDTRPMLMEKPLCISFEECEKIEEMSQKYSTPIWVAMEYRYMQAITNMREKLDDDVVGAPVMISVREHRFPFLKKVGDWNRFSAHTGGTLVEKCCHFFDLMRLLSHDEAVRVYASGAMDVNHKNERYYGSTPDIIDNAYVIVEFRSGVRASLDLNMFCDGSYFQEEIAVSGKKGKIECKIPGPDRLWAVDRLEELGHSTGFTGTPRTSQVITSLRTPKGPVVDEIKVDHSLQQVGDHHGATFYQHEKFNTVIQGKGKVEVSVYDGIQAVRIGLAAELSLREHRVIAL